ncbi:lipoprotein releasing system, transmembrane protein, LolC/E family [Geobacter metallireducens RCH3]|uniref:Lipoprotein release ABC transporter, membrane protein n=1 Tax=Geobacter metallireducens (strain ATCC 53774 / DSM 7210 / GS-15) TaxID=269799 RepID=Q39T40_GEOMG|nr:lipoprotein-releasing ABC transporter permease subunit [Geobacter metallireducens]ABB32584.1 lipoprotein release ABC transporter, membrane protein [Geobacter metallireducens GS-15]EHP86389.1 lipoprotein releasing system, transmembrane protein, LolC/E family [Geobacter metallireducens RCH3]
MSYELFIGLRYLKAKRKSTFISIITFISTAGVALGVMALIVVLAVMTGFEEDLKEKILGTNAHVVVLKSSGTMEDYPAIMERLKKMKGVVAATPFIYSQVMLSTGSNVSGVVLRGIDVKTDPLVTNLYRSLVEGKLGDLERSPLPLATPEPPKPGIIIGRELARSLNIYPGDTVNVISPLGNITPLGMVPKMKQFRVVGLFNTGMFEYDSTLAYVGLSEAQEFLSLGHAATGIQLRVQDVYRTGELVRKIDRELGFPFHARDWMQMNKNILFALKTEKMVMFVILTLIVLVAAFGIASTLFMVVLEKTKDIAILKSMGATGRSIMKIFVLEGLIIGISGTVIGVIGGLLVAYNLEPIVGVVQKVTGFELFSKDVYYLDHFPSRVVLSDVVLISVTAVLISLVATLYPSWQASKLPPAEALRYE